MGAVSIRSIDQCLRVIRVSRNGWGGESHVMAGRLSDNACKARFGVVYLRALCAQAAFPISETDPDEDVQAVDCTVHTPALPLRVQVKCTARDFNGSGELTFPVLDHWRAAWSENLHTLYFVVVRLNTLQPSWLLHQAPTTLQNAAAYWVAVNPRQIPATIRVPRTNELTALTLEHWQAQALMAAGG